MLGRPLLMKVNCSCGAHAPPWLRRLTIAISPFITRQYSKSADNSPPHSAETPLTANARTTPLSGTKKERKTGSRVHWTTQQIELLKHGSAERQPLQEIAEKIGRTPYACVKYARKSGIPIHKELLSHRWTKEEDEIIANGRANKESYAHIAQKLSHDVTPAACRSHARYLGITRYLGIVNRWSGEEIDILIRSRAEKVPFDQIARILNRSPNACRKQVVKLGFARQMTRWSEEEVEILTQEISTRGFVAGVTPYRLHEKLPHRTFSSCYWKALALRLIG